MKTDIEIAQEAQASKIEEIARAEGIDEKYLEQYGKDKAKVSYQLLKDTEGKPNGKLVLVTAIPPTPAGEGKTTTSVGLADGLKRLGKSVAVALREPSLGPVFGVKGGAAGGGYAQVIPMEEINLHFTGDFHAIGAANNLLAALIDNHIFQGNALRIDDKRITWKRAVDMNDRQLRNIIDGLGKRTDGRVREDGFEITVASEIMAVFCLAKDLKDLKERLARMIIGYNMDNEPVTAGDLHAEGALTALLKDALKPNLVQTIENTPAFIHGGPFANIAHGCNSILATKMAMSCSDYCITEAGFGADLGAEKFLDIKCRKAGISPVLTVLVATAQALKMHGGIDVAEISKPNVEGLKAGLPNLDKHIANLKAFGQTVVVCLNRFATDTDEELALVKEHCEAQGVGFAINTAFGEGGKGAEELAHLVVDTIEKKPSAPLNFVYEENDDIVTKVEKIAKKIYGAGKVVLRPAAKRDLQRIKELGFENFPVCIAKTQYSFSENAKAYGVPTDFTITIRDFVINAGAGMVVAIAGTIMRMPGLPKTPQAEHINVVNGVIEGLS